MPRKRRFKPSRKQAATVSSPSPGGASFDDRHEVHVSDLEIEHQAPARESDKDNSTIIDDDNLR
jgi:hypothetical protein